MKLMTLKMEIAEMTKMLNHFSAGNEVASYWRASEHSDGYW